MKIVFRSDIGRIRVVNEDSGWAEQRGPAAPAEPAELAEQAGQEGQTEQTGPARQAEQASQTEQTEQTELTGKAGEPPLTIAIVADGMGGHQAGDVASKLAVDTFREALEGTTGPLSLDERKMLIRQAILQANEVVYDMARQNERYHNMGTTVVAALLGESDGVIGHIGDSRAYKWRDGMLSRLTEDHTLVNELFKSGQITAEEAADHPRRNVLIRALGTDSEVEVDVRGFPWAPGDLLLLCSDGLTSMVSDEHISETVLSEELDLEGKADRLVELALQAGGDDNITVILLHHADDTMQEE